jgi:hypothetical protein
VVRSQLRIGCIEYLALVTAPSSILCTGLEPHTACYKTRKSVFRIWSRHTMRGAQGGSSSFLVFAIAVEYMLMVTLEREELTSSRASVAISRQL